MSILLYSKQHIVNILVNLIRNILKSMSYSSITDKRLLPKCVILLVNLLVNLFELARLYLKLGGHKMQETPDENWKEGKISKILW